MRKFSENQQASAVPLILFVITIVVFGALWTLFFIEIGFPTFDDYLPANDTTTFIKMLIYAMPLIAMVVGAISLMLSGLKREVYYP